MHPNKIYTQTDNFYLNNGFVSIFKGVIIPILLSLFVFYSCFVGSTLLSYFAFFSTIIYLLTCNFYLLLPTILYLSVFAELFVVGGIRLYSFTCLVLILRYFVISKSRIKILTWFILYSLTHIFSGAFTFANIGPILNILLLFVVCLSYKEDQFKNCSFMFLLGTILSSLLALLKPFSVNLQTILSEDVTEGIMTHLISRYSGLSFDPNFYTIIAFVSISLLLFDRQKKNWISLITISIIIYFGLITYSKSFIIIVVLTLMLFLIDHQKQKTYKLLFLSGIALIVFASILDNILAVVTLRFSNVSNLNELTTGRDYLWSSYWDAIINSSLFSFLFGQEMKVGVAAAHNTYLELLFRFGFIGFIVDMLYIIKCFTMILNRKWFSIVNLGIIGAIASLLFNLSAYTFPTLWSCLFMIFILISRRTSIQKI